MRLFISIAFAGSIFYLQNYVSDASSTEEEQIHLAGKNQYDNLLAKTKIPNFGKCWKSTLARVTDGCKHLTNTITHQLAYDFTRCFYIELGEDIPTCSVQPELCKDNLEPSILHGTYAMFFMHTRDMCFYLQNQVWQEKTEETVLKLSKTSEEVIEHLEHANGMQQRLAAGQDEALLRQQSILKSSDTLATKMNSLQTGAENMFGQFQLTYDKQMMAVLHVFDKITVLEKIFLAEYVGTQAFLLWLGCLIVGYILSATSVTYPARLPMFILTLVFAALEITVISGSFSEQFCHTLQDMNLVALDDNTVCRYHITKLWRWVYVVLNASVLIYYALTYEDYDTKIYKALVELKNDITVLKGKYSIQPLSRQDEGELNTTSKIEGIDAINRLNTAESFTSRTEEVEADDMAPLESDSDMDSSGSDSISDHSYRTPSSLSQSSTHVSDITDLSDVSQSELVSICREEKSDGDTLRRSVLNRNSSFIESPGAARYNLRPRSTVSTPSKVLVGETEQQFMALVKDLTRNRRQRCRESPVL